MTQPQKRLFSLPIKFALENTVILGVFLSQFVVDEVWISLEQNNVCYTVFHADFGEAREGSLPIGYTVEIDKTHNEIVWGSTYLKSERSKQNEKTRSET